MYLFRIDQILNFLLLLLFSFSQSLQSNNGRMEAKFFHSLHLNFTTTNCVGKIISKCQIFYRFLLLISICSIITKVYTTFKMIFDTIVIGFDENETIIIARKMNKLAISKKI